MTTNFEELFSKIPQGAKEGRWFVPTSDAAAAIAFLKSKAPGIQYTLSESWSDDDETIIRFISGDISIKNTDSRK
jgi:hypothetical protein